MLALERKVMTDLEEQLASPSGETKRIELLAKLEGMEQRLRGRIAASVPRDEFADWQAAAEAVAVAADVLRRRSVGARAPE